MANQTGNSGEANVFAMDRRTPQPQATVSFTIAGEHATGHNGPAATMTTPVAEESAQAQEALARTNDPLVVQNKYGQIITIHQTPAVEEEAVVSGKATPLPMENQRLDVSGNYIKAHLPGEGAQNKTEEHGDRRPNEQGMNNSSRFQQPETAAFAETIKDGTGISEQSVTHKGQQNTLSEYQPLIFAHQRSGGQMTVGSTSPESMFRLPSGSAVPEGSVVDQMIAHFSMNKRLETGTVNLKLYPQELGELRMEIKVNHDNIKAHIIAQNPQAQEMIDRHLPRLREALEQQGLHLQHVEVTLADQGNTGQERFRENNAWQQPAAPRRDTSPDQPIFSLEIDEIAGDEYSAADKTLSILA
jgi:flagellar hook-length control protein FliK